MEIEIKNINFKENDKIIFNGLNLNLPLNKIIGFYGNNYNYFIDLIRYKNYETGEIIDNGLFDRVLIIKDYNYFITGTIIDELSICSLYDENSIDNIIKTFNIEESFIYKNIYELSSFEKELLTILKVFLSNDKVVIIENLFNNLDYLNKKYIIKMLIKIKNMCHIMFFINDRDINTVYSFIDSLMIIDDNLCVIDKPNKVLDMKEIEKINIVLPDLFLLTKMLNERGMKLSQTRNINSFIKELKQYEV